MTEAEQGITMLILKRLELSDEIYALEGRIGELNQEELETNQRLYMLRIDREDLDRKIAKIAKESASDRG